MSSPHPMFSIAAALTRVGVLDADNITGYIRVRNHGERRVASRRLLGRGGKLLCVTDSRNKPTRYNLVAEVRVENKRLYVGRCRTCFCVFASGKIQQLFYWKIAI